MRLPLGPSALRYLVGAALQIVGSVSARSLWLALHRRCARAVARQLLMSIALATAVVTLAPAAHGRLETASPYTRLQTLNGALRYLRVDMGFEVLERDMDAGYLLFEYVAIPGRAPSRGAIEVIEVKDEVKVVVQLPGEPSHHETVLSEGLMRKLELEFGEPPRKDTEDDSSRADDDEKGDADDDEGDGSDDSSEGDSGAEQTPSKKLRRKLKRRQRRD